MISNVTTQQLPTPSSTIHLSKPIPMIFPNQKHQTVLVSSSSSSEGTLTDSSSESLHEIVKHTPKLQPQQKQKTKKKTKPYVPKEVVV
jgi:hypothetical protein